MVLITRPNIERMISEVKIAACLSLLSRKNDPPPCYRYELTRRSGCCTTSRIVSYTRNYISAVGSARQQVNCPTRGVDQNLSFQEWSIELTCSLKYYWGSDIKSHYYYFLKMPPVARTQGPIPCTKPQRAVSETIFMRFAHGAHAQKLRKCPNETTGFGPRRESGGRETLFCCSSYNLKFPSP